MGHPRKEFRFSQIGGIGFVASFFEFAKPELLFAVGVRHVGTNHQNIAARILEPAVMDVRAFDLTVARDKVSGAAKACPAQVTDHLFVADGFIKSLGFVFVRESRSDSLLGFFVRHPLSDLGETDLVAAAAEFEALVVRVNQGDVIEMVVHQFIHDKLIVFLLVDIG